MLTHVVLMTFKEDVTEQQLAECHRRLAELPSLVPEIRTFTCGRDAGISPGAAGMAMVATFDTIDDFQAYRANPAHVACGKDVLLPITTTRTQIQFET